LIPQASSHLDCQRQDRIMKQKAIRTPFHY